jgi:MFS family permease
MYYLPVWFQAIEGVSAVESGIRSLPLILGFVISTIIGGGIVTKYGYYAPCMIVCSVLMSIGAGLLTTLTTTSGSRQWIGFQVLLGLGVGLGLQQGLIAVQTVLPSKDIPSGTAVVIFSQSLGAAACLAIAQTIFTNFLVTNLAATVPELDPKVVTNVGATNLQDVVPAEFALGVQVAYSKALTETFYMGVGTACLSIIGSLFIEWKSVKKYHDSDAEANVTEADRLLERDNAAGLP